MTGFGRRSCSNQGQTPRERRAKPDVLPVVGGQLPLLAWVGERGQPPSKDCHYTLNNNAAAPAAANSQGPAIQRGPGCATNRISRCNLFCRNSPQFEASFCSFPPQTKSVGKVRYKFLLKSISYSNTAFRFDKHSLASVSQISGLSTRPSMLIPP